MFKSVALMSALMRESVLMEVRRERLRVVEILTGAGGVFMMGPDLGDPVALKQLHSSPAARRRGTLDLESIKGGEGMEMGFYSASFRSSL